MSERATREIAQPLPPQRTQASTSSRALVAATTRLTTLDEFYLHLDSDREPWGVHFEVAIDGRLDERRLGAAIEAAAARHPLARARLGNWRATDVRYHWEITDRLERVPLEVGECPDGPSLATARERLLGTSVRLTESPPFALLLARRPGGDSLILNIHHGAADGISAVRLMMSILRAYAGTPDPLAAVDPLAARDIASLAGASLGARIARGRELPGHLAELSAAPVRVARDGGAERDGYGLELCAFSRAETRALFARRPAGTSVNDLLLGALALTIWRWNEEHGNEPGRVALTMPVNMRPADSTFEVLGNFAACVRVTLPPRHRRDLAAATEAVATRTRRIKETRRAGLVVDLLGMSSAMPCALKRRFGLLLPLTGNAIIDTAVLSNLGRIPKLPGRVREVFFSPPGRMPLGVSLGAATAAGRLFLTLRYRHPQFDARAAAAFMRLLRET